MQIEITPESGPEDPLYLRFAETVLFVVFAADDLLGSHTQTIFQVKGSYGYMATR